MYIFILTSFCDIIVHCFSLAIVWFVIKQIWCDLLFTLWLLQGLSIGNGVYFAAASAYSVGGFCPADASGYKYIYQARVLTGKYTSGQGGLKEPPAGFDSVADNPSSPGIFVVFFDAQTYPEYLVTFK